MRSSASRCWARQRFCVQYFSSFSLNFAFAGSNVVRGQLAGFPALFLALLALAFFDIVGHVEFVAAVMAVAYSFAQVDGERFVSFVSAGVVALGADGLDFSAGAATGVDAVLMEISHFC